MTPEDIRKLRLKITLAACRGARFDGGDGPSTAAGIIASNILRSSEVTGLSGEDTMTLLAFEALRRVEALVDREIRRAWTEPVPQVVVKDMPL